MCVVLSSSIRDASPLISKRWTATSNNPIAFESKIKRPQQVFQFDERSQAESRYAKAWVPVIQWKKQQANFCQSAIPETTLISCAYNSRGTTSCPGGEYSPVWEIPSLADCWSIFKDILTPLDYSNCCDRKYSSRSQARFWTTKKLPIVWIYGHRTRHNLTAEYSP